MAGYILTILGLLLAAFGWVEGSSYGLFESLFLSSIGIGLMIAGIIFARKRVNADD